MLQQRFDTVKRQRSKSSICMSVRRIYVSLLRQTDVSTSWCEPVMDIFLMDANSRASMYGRSAANSAKNAMTMTLYVTYILEIVSCDKIVCHNGFHCLMR